MEAYFLATGAMHNMKMFETHMQSQPFYLNTIQANGQPAGITMFGMLEPLMLYRYIFPKEAKGLVLSTLNFNKNIHQPLPTPILWSIRKALGLRQAEQNEVAQHKELPVFKKDLHIIPLGIKDDETRLFHESGVTQEAI